MKLLYRSVGVVSLGLGTLGVFLPLLPTTCFVLLSAWCFARSSPAWHARLTNNPVCGPLIRNWQERRCIPESAKYFAIGSIVISAACSVLAFEHRVIRAIVIGAVIAGVYGLSCIRSCSNGNCGVRKADSYIR